MQDQIEHSAVIFAQIFPLQSYDISTQRVLIAVNFGLRRGHVLSGAVGIVSDHIHRPEHAVLREICHLLRHPAALSRRDRRRFEETFVQKLQGFVLLLFFRHILDKKIGQLFQLLAKRQQKDCRANVKNAVDDRNVRRIDPLSQKIELHDRVSNVKDT